MWQDFIINHVANTEITWNMNTSPTYYTVHIFSASEEHLYTARENGYLQ